MKNMASRENEGCEAPQLHRAWDSPASYTWDKNTSTHTTRSDKHQARHLLHVNYVIPERNEVSLPLKTFSIAKLAVSRCVFHVPSWKWMSIHLAGISHLVEALIHSLQKPTEAQNWRNFLLKDFGFIFKRYSFFFTLPDPNCSERFCFNFTNQSWVLFFAETAFSIKDIFNWLLLINLNFKAVFNITCQ